MIIVKELTKKFEKIVAVNNISFNIKDGEIFGFLGPNGAGKTTTIRMLTTLIRPSSGTIEINGMDSSLHAEKIRKIIGILTETPGMYEKISAFDNLRYFASFYSMEDLEIKKNIEKFLRMFGLWERRNDMVATFSKGMKQKLSISRALIHEPKILFLDEPTAGLDPESAFMVRKFIENMKNDKTTVFLCTHNLEEAQTLCDTVCIIKNKIIKISSLKELQNLKNIKTFILKVKKHNDRIVSIIENFRKYVTYRIENEEIILNIEDFENNNPLLIKELVNNNAEIIYFSEKKESLEEIYLELIKG
ncbi:MAG: ABC transporter ATP-binding protein [Actinomycetota bacterium]|nr:ABC transporter ATP-binding protein [Actinomycetota bacterium]